MNIAKRFIILIPFLLAGCTTGQLYYVDPEGNKKLGCDVEFVGMPSVDKYAVEYALSLCAKNFVENGHTINETYLLDIDTTIPAAPCGEMWTHQIAKQQFKNGELSKKEYGYIVAHIDMGLGVLNECMND